MKIMEKLAALCDAANNKFSSQFGFKIEDITFAKIVHYMHAPKDSSSLAVTRILFGLAMLFDIPDERGGAAMEARWGGALTCRFPLLPFLRPVPMPHMAAVYAGLWFGAIGIMLGYKYRCSSAVFTVCYWYLFLAEKSYWNNHSYLFGLVALLLTCTEAHCYWSIDAYLDPTKLKTTVPYWNYFILKYQFFILYFMAGLKKGTAEWLTGYSVQNLSDHWVFGPFKIFLTVPQTDYLIVHWFVFVFDLTVALWMMYSSTRLVAMIFCALFHLMNSRLFRIGMFPWVCLATMPLFCPFDWPKKLSQKLTNVELYICSRITEFRSQDCDCHTKENEESNVDTEVTDDNFVNDHIEQESELKNGNEIDFLDTIDNIKATQSLKKLRRIRTRPEINGTENRDIDVNLKHTDARNTEGFTSKHKITVCLIILYVLSQAFLPFSHFVTKGYNNWTNGLYGYSWDMMVHTWDTHAVIVQIVDNDRHNHFYIDPYIYTPNERWTRHGDMVHQYAKCLRDNLMKESARHGSNGDRLLSNISIYVDVWCSMNGRFTQRIFDPKVDLLKAEWRPFETVSYVMPLLDEALDWRKDLEEIRQEVHSWNNYSDVIFLADFPGYEQEKYISQDLQNVTLTVLEGVVAYQPEVTKLNNGYSVQLTTGDRLHVANGIFHKVINIGHNPAFYMYTFYNNTEIDNVTIEIPKFPLFTELYIRFYKMITFCNVMVKGLVQMCLSFSKCY